MNERITPPLQALPDGDAELRVVLHLTWEDVAALGQEAGRLAAQAGRPVGMDEAISHRLRTARPAPAAHAKPAAERSQPAAASAPPPTGPLMARTPGEQARQAIEKINANSPQPQPQHNGTADTTSMPQPAAVVTSAPSVDTRSVVERPR